MAVLFYLLIGASVLLLAIEMRPVRAGLDVGARTLGHWLTPLTNIAAKWSASRMGLGALARLGRAGGGFWRRGLLLSLLILIFEIVFDLIWHFLVHKLAGTRPPPDFRLPLWMDLLGYLKPSVIAFGMFWWGTDLLGTARVFGPRLSWRQIIATLLALIFFHFTYSVLREITAEIDWVTTSASIQWPAAALALYFASRIAIVLASAPALLWFVELNEAPASPALTQSWRFALTYWREVLAVLVLNIGIYWLIARLIVLIFTWPVYLFSLAFYVSPDVLTPLWLFLGPLSFALMLEVRSAHGQDLGRPSAILPPRADTQRAP